MASVEVLRCVVLLLVACCVESFGGARTGHNGSAVFSLYRRQSEGGQLPPSWKRHLTWKDGDTAPVYGDFSQLAYFYADVWVGSPPSRHSVIIDTGSALMAFPCKGCSRCGSHMNAKYDPSASRTSHKVTCTSGEAHCSTCTGDMCGYVQSYAEGSSLRGVLYKDKVFIGEAKSPDSAEKYGVDFIFGCHTSEAGLFSSQLADGIMGLAAGGNSIFDYLYRKGDVLPAPILTLCFSLKGGLMGLGGETGAKKIGSAITVPLKTKYGSYFYHVDIHAMKIGGQDLGASSSSYNSGSGTFIDSGTSFTYLASGVYRSFYSTIVHFCSQSGNCKGRSVSVRGEDLCYSLNKPGDISTFPSVTYTMAGGGSFVVAPENVFFKMAWDQGNYCLGFYNNGRGGTVIGANSMMGHEFLFDLAKKHVVITPSTCSAPPPPATPSPSPSVLPSRIPPPPSPSASKTAGASPLPSPPAQQSAAPSPSPIQDATGLSKHFLPHTIDSPVNASILHMARLDKKDTDALGVLLPFGGAETARNASLRPSYAFMDQQLVNDYPLAYTNFLIPVITGNAAKLWRPTYASPLESLPGFGRDIDGSPVAALTMAMVNSLAPRPLVLAATAKHHVIGVDWVNKATEVEFQVPTTLSSTYITSIVAVSTGSYMVVGLSSGEVSTVTLNNGSLVSSFALHTRSVTHTLALADGTVVSASEDGYVAAGSARHVPQWWKGFAHNGGVTGLAAVEGGKKFFSVGEDGCVVLWAADPLQPLYRMDFGSQGLTAVGSVALEVLDLVLVGSRSGEFWLLSYTHKKASSLKVLFASDVGTPVEALLPVVVLINNTAIDLQLFVLDRSQVLRMYTVDAQWAESNVLGYWPAQELGAYNSTLAASTREGLEPHVHPSPSPSNHNRGPKPSVVKDTMEADELYGGSVGMLAIVIGCAAIVLILGAIIASQRGRR